MAAQIDPAEAALVALIVNPPEGDVCFLCATSDGRECVWNEIGPDIVAFGRFTGMNYGEQHRVCSPPVTLADVHKACRFACYRRYIFTASNWSTGMGCIRIPSCVENSIRHAFPGDGVFVGFQARDHN